MDGPVSKQSKNFEMTGQRARAYDKWRAGLPGAWTTIPFVEYTRIGGQKSDAWPLFDLHAVVLVEMTGKDAPPTSTDMEVIYSQHRLRLEALNDISERMGCDLPFYVVALNGIGTHVAVQRRWADRDRPRPKLEQMCIDQYIREVLHQQPRSRDLIRTSGDTAPKYGDYSAWHRAALADSAYVQDVDYVELRGQEPAAVIEVTQANTSDLNYGLFSFLSRSFAQMAVLVQIAEKLGVRAYLVSVPEDLTRLAILGLDKTLVPAVDAWDRQRQDLATERLPRSSAATRKDRSIAQGKATSALYDREGRSAVQKLPGRRELTQAEYTNWLSTLHTSDSLTEPRPWTLQPRVMSRKD